MIWFEVDSLLYKIDIPPGVEHITFNDWCEFRNLEARYLLFEGPTPEGDAILLQALAKIVNGRLDKLPVYIPGDNMKEIIENGFQLQLDEPISLTRLYAHILTMVNAYVPDVIPDTFKYTWFGTRFEVRQGPAARVLISKPVTTGEAIEVMEFQRRAALRKETKPLDVGNIDFNLGMREFAILVRKRGEKLPANRRQRQQFIDKRMKLFKDLPLNVVLNMRFFFIKSVINYNKKKHIAHFGRGVLVRKGKRKTTTKKRLPTWWKRPGR